MAHFGDLMKKAKEMQKQMETAQEQVRQTQIKAEVAGGAVAYTCNGEGEPIAIRIHPDLLQDPSMLEASVVAVIQEANKQRVALVERLMKGVTNGLSLPGMPF
jgi:DNA-binding YbaB/EbfC family protein